MPFPAMTLNVNDPAVANNSVIYASHITQGYTAIQTVHNWFTAANLPGRLNLTTAEAALIFPQVTVASPAAGEVWRSGDVLNFRTSGNVTKTFAFTDGSLEGLAVTGSTALSLQGSALDIQTATKVRGSNASLLSVRNTAQTVTYFNVDNASATVNVSVPTGEFYVGDSTKFKVVATNGNTTVAGTLNVTGATTLGTVSSGAISSSGQVSATSIVSSGAISRTVSGVTTAFAEPLRLNAAGFTVNLGNGSDNITTGAQLPLVVIPYNCTIEASIIVTAETTGAIELKLQRRTGASTWEDLITLISISNAATSNLVGPTTHSQALSQNNVLRLNVTSASPTLKSVAVHFRLNRL